MRTLVRALPILAVTAAALMTTEHAHAQSSSFFKTCTSQMSTLPTDVLVSPLSMAPKEYFGPNFANTSNQNTCSSWTWFQTFSSAVVGIAFGYPGSFGGPAITTSAWDCNHSAIMLAVYQKLNGFSGWTYLGSVTHFGDLVNGQCRYDAAGGFASSHHRASSRITIVRPTTPGSTPTITVVGGGQIRVAARSWAHNDPAFGHPGTLCGSTECFYGTRLYFFGQ